MARFPSLPEQPHLADVFRCFGRGVWPLCEYHDVVLRTALFDAIAICALFNFMNRIVEGCGVVKNEANLAASRSRHEANLDNPAPYRAFARQIGFSPE